MERHERVAERLVCLLREPGHNEATDFMDSGNAESMTHDLFSTGELRLSLDSQMSEVGSEIQSWHPDDMLTNPELDTIEMLLEKYEVNCPVLMRSQATLLPISEESDQFTDMLGRSVSRLQTKVTLVVPFEGDPAVFNLRASQFTFNPPRADVRGNELILDWIGEGNNAAAVRAVFDGELSKIETHLEWSRADIRGPSPREWCNSGS